MSEIKKMQKEISKFCKDRNWDQFHELKDLAIGVSTEASEILELFRFRTNTEANKLLKTKKFKQDLSDELADVLYFILRLSEISKIDIKKAFKNKMKKNSSKYPIKKSRGKNKKYTEL